MANRSALKTTSAAVSATTVVVLVAMASAVAAGPVPATPGEAIRQRGRAPMAAMAAAVAAAARDLMTDSTAAVLPTLLPVASRPAAAPRRIASQPSASPRPAAPPLDERLLDLPPPAARI